MTYASNDGVYSIVCKGAHTVYIRNDNMTRMLVGDVYHTDNKIYNTIDLRVGPVAILIPLRGVGQSIVRCSIHSETSSTVKILPIENIPSMLEVRREDGGKPNHGILLSNLFNLPIINTQTQSLSVEISLESIKSINGR